MRETRAAHERVLIRMSHPVITSDTAYFPLNVAHNVSLRHLSLRYCFSS